MDSIINNICEDNYNNANISLIANGWRKGLAGEGETLKYSLKQRLQGIKILFSQLQSLLLTFQRWYIKNNNDSTYCHSCLILSLGIGLWAK